MAHFFCRRPPGGGSLSFTGLLGEVDLGEVDHEEAEAQRRKLPPPTPGTGWINDLVARAGSQKLQAGDPILQLLTPWQQRRLLRMVMKANFDYAFVVEAINSENLQTLLTEVAVRFWKQADAKNWRTEPGAFQRQAWRILLLKRQASDLKDESESCYRRRFYIETLKAHRILENRESPEKKIQRLEEFWPQFHQVCRNSEDLADLIPPDLPEAKIPLGGPETGTEEPVKEKRADLARAREADWKTRPSRSRNMPKISAKDEGEPLTPKSRALSWWLQERLQSPAPTPAKGKKLLRHMMIRRPLGVVSRAPSLATSPKTATPATPATPLTPATPGTPATLAALSPAKESRKKRKKKVQQAFTPSTLLSDGYITGWADLGLGSVRYDERKAKVVETETIDSGRGSESAEGSGTSPRGLAAGRVLPSMLDSIFFPGRRSQTMKLAEPAATPQLRRPASAASLRTCKDSTANVYLQVCESQKLLPRPAPIVTGHSFKLDARNQGLTDSELAACRVPIADLQRVDSVDLEANVKLSDQAIAEFLVALGNGPGNKLSFLSLKGCVGAAFNTAAALLELLHVPPALASLKYLDLSGIKFTAQSLSTLCNLIGQHPCVESLFLADVGIGSSGSGELISPWMHSMLRNQSLRELDLSWNLLDSEVFFNLGRCVTQSQLSCLRISCCASRAMNENTEGPAASFLEHLSSLCPLRELDISLNHIDYRAALVLEDLLSQNSRLTALDLSNNPIGAVGMRCFARLLVREESGLSKVRFDGCASGSMLAADLQFININNPGGRYTLQLDRPDHRSVLRMLYKTCDRLGIPASEAFSNLSFSRGTYNHPPVGPDGVYEVCRDGRLQATFKIEKAVHQALQVDGADFSGFIQKRNEMMRLCPSERKQILLFHAWRTVSNVDPDQAVFLSALARDIRLPFALIQQMCKSCTNPAEVVSKLFPSFASVAPERYLTLMTARSISEVTKICKFVGSLLFFNVENPTGHYRLDLASPVDYSTAESIVFLDSWETAMRRSCGKVDTSQTGNWSQVRNSMFCDRRLEAPIISEWLLPEVGKLELDYSSSKRPPSGAPVLDADSFQRMLIALQDQNFYKKGDVASQAKLPRNDMQALRMVSHLIYLNAYQTRALLECFLDASDREDCLVTLFNRIADMHNEKLFSVRFEGDSEQVNRLRRRLGTLVFFPWIQPEQATFSLFLENVDERMALCSIINLAKKERMSNLVKPRWMKGDGSEDPLAFGLPRSWETLSNIPLQGTVYISYRCAPEDRNFKVRKGFLETYSNWPCKVGESEVLWWASTNEVPVDVMEFLEFLAERYDNVYEAFDDIKPSTTPVLTLRQFEEGLRRVKCRKFRGKREMEKITGVFRYLDPSGEGQVSRNEWGMLELCHKEMVYSIQEFVQFCQRSFGNDLNAAWAVFDLNGDNYISEAEWVSVARSFSYFGPTLPIFRFLDKDDEGTISFEEFEELKKFCKPSKPEVKAMEKGYETLRANGAIMRDFPCTRIRLRARLQRARAGAGTAGTGRLPTRTQPMLDEATLANLKHALPKVNSAVGVRVATAVERFIVANGVKGSQITVMKVNLYKEGLRELVCDVAIPQSVSPCGVARTLKMALGEATQPEAVSLLHVLRVTSAQVSTLQIEVRPSKERLLHNLRAAIPSVTMSQKKVTQITEAALKCSSIYMPVMESQKDQVQELMSRPSKSTHCGALGTAELPDPAWHGVRLLSGLLALAGAAQQRLKATLAPNTAWAKGVFGESVPQRHQCRWHSGAGLIPEAAAFDPGVQKRERLCEEVMLAQRMYEQDTAAHDLVASKLELHFERLRDLVAAWDTLESSLEVVWVRNRFREPDSFGYPCVRIGVCQYVQDPRHKIRECTVRFISEITLHCTAFVEAKESAGAFELQEELQVALAACGVNATTFDLAEAVVADALDCTAIQIRRSAVQEVERVLAFLERYAPQIGEEEKGPAKVLLEEAIAQAVASGCAASSIAAHVARLSPKVPEILSSLEKVENQDPQQPRRPVLIRLTAVVSQLKVETVEFHFRDGSKKAFVARALECRDSGAAEDTSTLSFDLTSDYVVAIEQAAVGHSSSLGAQLMLFTAMGQTLPISGRRQRSPPSRVRWEVHSGHQIVGLEVEFGRLVGLQTAMAPEEADLEL